MKILLFSGKKKNLDNFFKIINRYPNTIKKMLFLYEDSQGIWYKFKTYSKKDAKLILKFAKIFNVKISSLIKRGNRIVTVPLFPKREKVVSVVVSKEKQEKVLDPKFIKYEQTPGINILTTPLEEAKEYVKQEFADKGLRLEKELPRFDANYLFWQDRMKKYSIGVSRSEMPVIEPTDIDDFKAKLATGRIDIFKPHTFGGFVMPGDVEKRQEGWLILGQLDENKTDDVLRGKIINIPVKKLKPLQTQIWLKEVVSSMLKFGVPNQNSKLTKLTIVISKDYYILDGHHRVTQLVLTNPNLKIEALCIPLDIKTLIKVGKGYSEAIGRTPYE